MPIDIAAFRRRYKPERLLAQFSPRAQAALVSAADAEGVRRVLLDTTVYIHEVAGTLPQEVTGLLDRALRFHCSLCIAEIMSGLGKLHPNSPHFEPGWAHYQRLFSSVPPSRLATPDSDILVQACVVSGILARTQNHEKLQSRKLFNDAVVLLTAAKLGLPVLTANRDDFDLVQQVAGQGTFIHYAAI